MLFNSFGYAIFLPLIFAVYWLLPKRARWVALLISSYYFYMGWGPKYVLVILFTTLVSYFGGLMLERAAGRPRSRKTILTASLVLCLFILFLFKYLTFFSDSLASLLNRFSIPVQPLTLKLMLPIGLSFYTFQTVSYLVDVYRGTIPAEHQLGIYAVYVSFFPKMMQGPIERGSKLLPQLRNLPVFSYAAASYGLKLMAWGYFKKLVLADGLSVYVSQVYNNLPQYTGFSLLLSTLLYSIQIYCDFSGYTDIALGSARLLGINLTQNFKSPYFAASIKEFWGRWHISLSSWLRDYIYIPLGGNRVGSFRRAANIMITFLVSGLWHGANWTYVVWGGIHGVFQIIEGWFPWNHKKSPFQTNRTLHFGTSLITIPFTFLLVCFAWIFFRANSLADAWYVVQNMFHGISDLQTYIVNGAVQMNLVPVHLLFNCLPIVLLFIYDLVSLKTDVISLVTRQRFFIRWPLYILLLLIILLFSEKGVSTEFIYMQF